jgi:hypothetical protein
LLFQLKELFFVDRQLDKEPDGLFDGAPGEKAVGGVIVQALLATGEGGQMALWLAAEQGGAPVGGWAQWVGVGDHYYMDNWWELIQ